MTSGPTSPSRIGMMTSPASRSADSLPSTTTVARATSSESTSRASGSWLPTATTVASSPSQRESNTGYREVVAQTTTSAARIGASRSSGRSEPATTSAPIPFCAAHCAISTARPRSRPTTVTCATCRTAATASTCP